MWERIITRSKGLLANVSQNPMILHLMPCIPTTQPKQIDAKSFLSPSWELRLVLLSVTSLSENVTDTGLKMWIGSGVWDGGLGLQVVRMGFGCRGLGLKA